MAKKYYLKLKFDLLSGNDVKYISKKIKLSIEKTLSLLEEEDDFYAILFSIAGKSRIKIKEMKNLSSSFIFVKRLSEICDEEEINEKEKIYFLKKSVRFFIRMKSDKEIVKQTDFKSLNPDRSFISLLSLTIFRGEISDKEEEGLSKFEKIIDENNVEGFLSGKDSMLRDIAKNYFSWKNRLNKVMDE